MKKEIDFEGSKISRNEFFFFFLNFEYSLTSALSVANYIKGDE